MKETTTDGQEIITDTAGICACGRRIETTGIGFQYREYDGNGNVIYEVCSHGTVVINKRVKRNNSAFDFWENPIDNLLWNTAVNPEREGGKWKP